MAKQEVKKIDMPKHKPMMKTGLETMAHGVSAPVKKGKVKKTVKMFKRY